VLFTPDWQAIGKLFWINKKSCTLFIYLFNPQFLYDLFFLVKNGAVLVKCITYLSGRYPYFARYEQFIFCIANTQKPIPQTINLVKLLKERGYTLHIFSNIGTALYQKLESEFPHTLMLFSQAFTPDGFHGKNHQDTFTDYLEYFNQDHKQIIFIDNNKNNISLAAAVGIISIYYKNPEQLHTSLHNLDVI
jgi:FMN phosphatase YigB (HAD superfamily)